MGQGRSCTKAGHDSEEQERDHAAHSAELCQSGGVGSFDSHSASLGEALYSLSMTGWREVELGTAKRAADLFVTSGGKALIGSKAHLQR